MFVISILNKLLECFLGWINWDSRFSIFWNFCLIMNILLLVQVNYGPSTRLDELGIDIFLECRWQLMQSWLGLLLLCSTCWMLWSDRLLFQDQHLQVAVFRFLRSWLKPHEQPTVEQFDQTTICSRPLHSTKFQSNQTADVFQTV